jgi:hypothetical protein
MMLYKLLVLEFEYKRKGYIIELRKNVTFALKTNLENLQARHRPSESITIAPITPFVSILQKTRRQIKEIKTIVSLNEL